MSLSGDLESVALADGSGAATPVKRERRLCLNCNVTRAVRRGVLCWRCFYTPGVKEKFPSPYKESPIVKSLAKHLERIDKLPPPSPAGTLPCMICPAIVPVSDEFKRWAERMRMPWKLCADCEAAVAGK